MPLFAPTLPGCVCANLLRRFEERFGVIRLADTHTPIDTLIDGLAEAQLKGHWQPREASEQRRLALLPQTPALDWDSLMVHGPYMQALDWLP